MSHGVVIEKLQDNLKQIYKQAVDADQALEQLKEKGMGKFSTIFEAGSGFNRTADRFLPYVEELAADLDRLRQADAQGFEAQLQPMLHKLQLMHQMLTQFRTSLK